MCIWLKYVCATEGKGICTVICLTKRYELYLYIYICMNYKMTQLNYIVSKSTRLQVLYQLMGNLIHQTHQPTFVDIEVLSKLRERSSLFEYSIFPDTLCLSLLCTAHSECIDNMHTLSFFNLPGNEYWFWRFNSLLTNKNIQERRQECLLCFWKEGTLLF